MDIWALFKKISGYRIREILFEPLRNKVDRLFSTKCTKIILYNHAG